MAERFGVGPGYPEALTSINQARNCLAHRRGVVGSEDCNDGDELLLRWWPIQFYSKTPDGKKEVVELLLTEPAVGPSGASLYIGRGEQIRRFPRKTVVKLSPKELHEICLFVKFSADEVETSVLQYCDKLGIPSE